MPLPSTTFDPIRWESRRADKYGQIDIDSNRYLAGAALHGRTLLAAIRRDGVRITDPGTGVDRRAVPPGIRTEPVHAAGSGTGHARARGQTRILEGIVDTPDFPEDVRAWLDEADSKRLAQSLRSIGRGMRGRRFRQRGRGREPGDSRRAGFGIGRIHARHPRPCVHATPMAGAITDDGPDLAGYDRFITGNGGKETER